MSFKDIVDKANEEFYSTAESKVIELLIRNNLYDSNMSIMENISKLKNSGIKFMRSYDPVSIKYTFIISGDGVWDGISFNWRLYK